MIQTISYVPYVGCADCTNPVRGAAKSGLAIVTKAESLSFTASTGAT